MTRSQSLWARLAADSAITGLIGSGANMRLYPLVALPPNGQTACTYKFNADPDMVLDGVSSIKSALEIRCWAQDYDAAHALADAINASLQGFKGTLGGTSGSPATSGINVIELTWTHEEETFLPITPDDGMFEVLSQYDITYLS